MPGEKAPSKKKQLEWLLGKFAGHQSFHRLRGKLQQPAIDQMIGHTAKGDPRRAGQEKFRQIADDLILIQSTIAQFERDGWDYALEHLKSALTIPGYLFPGEETPIDLTTEMLLIVPNFYRTIRVLIWMKKYGGYEAEKRVTDEEYEKLYPTLPSLEATFQERSQMCGKTPLQRGVALGMAGGQDLDLPKRPDIHRDESGFVGPCRNIEFGVHLYYLGWLIPVKWQKDFLRQVPRADQKKLTTWHIKMPSASLTNKFNSIGRGGIRIGFHLTSKHKKLRRLYPAFTSLNIWEGWGILCWPHKENPEEYPKENFLCDCH